MNEGRKSFFSSTSRQALILHYLRSSGEFLREPGQLGLPGGDGFAQRGQTVLSAGGLQFEGISSRGGLPPSAEARGGRVGISPLHSPSPPPSPPSPTLPVLLLAPHPPLDVLSRRRRGLIQHQLIPNRFPPISVPRDVLLREEVTHDVTKVSSKTSSCVTTVILCAHRVTSKED